MLQGRPLLAVALVALVMAAVAGAALRSARRPAVALAAASGRPLPLNKCLKCGRGTDAIPCQRCGNRDRNQFAAVKVCTTCDGDTALPP